MATTETKEKTVTATVEEETCPNGYETCEGPDDEMPCFQCYCEGYESEEDEESGEEYPECGEELEYGTLLDSVTGQRGWGCDDCNVVYSSLEL